MASNEPIAVSVIVPARNEEACLGLCLESLATQTGIPLEIVVVDDASTDRTVEIARSFANRAGLASPQPAPTSKVTSRSATGQGGAVCSDNAGSSSISQDDSLANHPAEPTQTDTKREGTA
ncbi:MAG TPA: glycosyltransferase, partial [Terriglobales bacterium]|nr:glycosyltransferase [Terriglobales bacterium]